MSDQLWEAAKAAAAAEGTTVSEIIVASLQRFVDDHDGRQMDHAAG